MELDPGVVFLTGYECPGCGADLELPGRRADSWLRCPRCGRPSEPPDASVVAVPWGSSMTSADRSETGVGPIRFGATPPGTAASTALKVIAPVLFGTSLAIDLVLRFIVGVDPMVQMAADIAAFLAFSFCGVLVLRAMIQP